MSKTKDEVGTEITSQYVVTISAIAASTGGYLPSESFEAIKDAVRQGWIEQEVVDTLEASFTILGADEICDKVEQAQEEASKAKGTLH